MANAQRDQNRVTGLVVESSTGDLSIVPLYADPTTNRLLVEAYLSGNANENLALQTDVDGTTTYVGDADPGSGTDEAVWRIMRVVETSGDYSVTWADGDADFDNVWDNRAALSYS